jgi:hypothetical protein
MDPMYVRYCTVVRCGTIVKDCSYPGGSEMWIIERHCTYAGGSEM